MVRHLVWLAVWTLGVMAPGGTEPAQPDAEAVWIEGESAAPHIFNDHGWYCCSDVHADWLSPGDPTTGAPGGWLSHYDNNGRSAEATYTVDVVAGGAYTLWARLSSYEVAMWLAIDGGPRQQLNLDEDPREELNIIHPVLDIRFLSWHRLGTYSLDPGTHTLRFGLEHHPDRGPGEVHGAIDALALVNYPWAPAGTLKPATGPTPTPAPDDWFPLVPADNPHDPASWTDVSRALHVPAGAHGPLDRTGDALAFRDGTPARFWGVGATMASTPRLQEQQARNYAQHGINLVRQHPVQSVVGLLQDAAGRRALDPEGLDRLARWFTILRDRGIYMAWSPFYPHRITQADGYDQDLYAELPDAGRGRKSTAGFVAFMPALQEAEWAWLEALLTHVNPYTGVRFVDDPALAVLEVHNEDSIFWHFPLNDLWPPQDYPLHTAELQRQWTAWLRTRYADDAALFAAWGDVGAGRRPEDSLSNDRPALYGAWEMEADGPRSNKRETRRMGDFVRFLAETQRAYYERRGARLRALGFEGVLVSTAWQAGGPAAAAANTWTDDGLEMIDRHAYFGGSGGHRIVTGPIDNGTHLAAAGTGILSRGLEQVEDKPFLLSEWNQNTPNQWKAEIAPLIAFYGLGLQGWDAAIHFHSASPRMGSGWPRLSSYVSDTPHYMAQFPALALAVHRGDIAAGPPAAARRLRTDQLFMGVDSLTQRLPGGGYGGAHPAPSLATPNEALAIGRVTQKAGDDPAPSTRLDWEAFRDEGLVTSATGELVWDTRRRVVTVSAPRTQAVVGFAGGGRFQLPDIDVAVDTGFVSLLFTSLDDRPLADSRRILLTALARDKQLGARYAADGSELLAVGAPPLLLEPVQAQISLKHRPASRVQALDIHGRHQGDVPVGPDGFRIDGRYATYYYGISRGASPSPTAEPPGGRPGARTLHLPRTSTR